MVQSHDTVDSLGITGDEIQAEVRVQKRGFLRARLQYLHKGEVVSEGLVPIFDIAFTPKVTIGDLRNRLAAVMKTAGTAYTSIRTMAGWPCSRTRIM
jgi:hypothetical protein